jgi:hypothetical protein
MSSDEVEDGIVEEKRLKFRFVELIFAFFVFSGSSGGSDAETSVVGFVCVEMDVVVVAGGSV